MKIAYIVRYFNKRGGISGYTAEIANRVSAANEVHVFAAGIEDNDANIVKHIVPLTSSPYLKKLKKYAWNLSLEVPSFMRASKALVEKDSFDIIHSQGDFGGDCDVYTAHSCHRAWLKVARKNNNGLVDLLKKSALNPLHRAILRSEYYGIIKSNKIIAVSERIKKEVIENYPVPDAKVAVIPNGVDTKRFSPENKQNYRSAIRSRYMIREAAAVVLFPAHEFKRKGLPQVIEALSKLADKNLFLLVIGRDDPSQFEKTIREKGLEKQIIFAGEQAETEKYYAASDMMVFPTLYEPFGLVVSEAMASGLAVIVSSAAGASELITDGANGFLIRDRNDTAEIARKIKFVLDNRERSKVIGESARKTAQNHSWDAVSSKITSLYESVLKEKTI